MSPVISVRKSRSRGEFTIRLFLTAVVVYALCILIAWLPSRFLEPPRANQSLLLPPVFYLTTLFLAIGSTTLDRAVRLVRRERQSAFRRSLFVSLVTGTLFVGLQSYGIWYLLESGHAAHDVQTGAQGFAYVFVILHGLHFTVAMMFLIFVTLQSIDERYDHEYYWGVVVCAWFWHLLGAVWLAILAIFVIVL